MAEPPAPLPAAALARRLRDLGDDALVAFVADLWAARGYDVRIEDDRVIATRAAPAVEETLLVAVDPGAVDGETLAATDGVVAPTDGPRARRAVDGADVTLYGPARLRELLGHAMDRETADALCREHLGRTAFAESSSAPAVRSRAAVLLAVLALAAMTVGGVSVPLDAAVPADDDTTTVPTVAPAETNPETTTIVDTTTIQPVLQPDCDMSPDRVVRVQVDALRHNDPEHDHGIRTMWHHLTYEARTGFGSVETLDRALSQEQFRPLFEAEEVAYHPTNRSGGTATRRVTVRANGTHTRYKFTLRHQNGTGFGVEGCWLVADLDREATFAGNETTQSR